MSELKQAVIVTLLLAFAGPPAYAQTPAPEYVNSWQDAIGMRLGKDDYWKEQRREAKMRGPTALAAELVREIAGREAALAAIEHWLATVPLNDDKAAGIRAWVPTEKNLVVDLRAEAEALKAPVVPGAPAPVAAGAAPMAEMPLDHLSADQINFDTFWASKRQREAARGPIAEAAALKEEIGARRYQQTTYRDHYPNPRPDAWQEKQTQVIPQLEARLAELTKAEQEVEQRYHDNLEASFKSQQKAAIAAEKIRQKKEAEYRRAHPRPERSSGVHCCDGTESPTCTYVHRGCCSHHGGVCN